MNTRGLSSNSIKLIACAAMFCDHAVKALSVRGMPYTVLSLVIGRIAFPIFCFFLVEGFFHSRDRKNYLLRMLLFAVISEIPFDLAIFHTIWYPQHQNTLFSLTLGILLFFCLAYVESFREMRASLAWILKGLLVAGFALAAHVLHLDYGARGLGCMAIYYFLRNVKPPSLAAIWSCLCLNLYRFRNACAFLSMIPLHFYNGKRGSARLKYFFYIFYPTHLFALWLISKI